MTSTTPKAALEDRARERRKYVWKKTTTTIIAILTGCVAMLCALNCLIHGAENSRLDAWLGFGNLLLWGGPTLILYWLCQLSIERCDSLPIVPPVQEQIAALPVGEILVRGSHQPSTSADELVRAAQSQTVASQEELLRAGTEAAN